MIAQRINSRENRQRARLARIPECHPERQHCARGLCHACYQVQWRHARGITGDPDYHRAYYEQQKQQDPSLGRRRALQHKYGMSIDDYDSLYAAQEGRCAICLQGFALLHVDHDHATGLVRGLLCGSCNRGIGLLGECPERLQAAARYLNT